ncbi:hypothetical protein C4B60_15355 [Jeotgalibacillus proteolyticus]|uniref:Transporter n=1 Tax=Jeotgalibacillus proteolyticus TaxID=2082395 RepID=A0A2S5GAE4_9BACL|nr:hypothetical protein C4B60_15355 [Jeotgalibacillus proteolyticus]
MLSPITWFPLPGGSGGQPGGPGGFPGSGGPGFPGGGGQPGGPGFPGGGGGPGFPGGGGQPGGPGFPGGGGNISAPTGPPPAQIPPKPLSAGGPQAFLVNPNVIRPCLFRFTYVWLRNGAQFWFYPIVLGRNSVGGFYWNNWSRRWTYIGLDTASIEVVSCF